MSGNATDKVIVVLKNQVTGLPDTPANAAARSVAVQSLQRGVLSQLAASGARNVRSISLVNAVAATVSPGAARQLAANPAVAEVIPDERIHTVSPPAVRLANAPGFKPLPGACAPKGKVQLNPQAVETIHAAGSPSAQSLGYTGAGVKVAYIADGIDVNNPDFIRANGQHVFVDNKDFSGQGTAAPTGGGEAFLDAGSIAAQGRHVYNVAGYGAGLSVPCLIRILGAAPGASLVGLSVFPDAFNSAIVEAVDYAVTTDHVNVLNESLGSNPFPDVTSLNLFKRADEAAVRAGVTVTVATGDAGVTNTLSSPATDPAVISAGASTTLRAYAQAGVAGITTPGVTGWLDNNISAISSSGFDQTGRTEDVVAPGDLNWALCTPNTARFSDCANMAGQPTAFQLTGGTSEAAPLTAGVAALVIQAYRQAHGGATPSPAVVKQIIVSTAQNIDAPAELQGAGLLDAYQAVLAARSFRAAKPSGQAILASPAQLNAVGQPGTTEHFTETLTNDGAKTVTVGLSTRALSPYTTAAAASLTLTNGAGYATAVTFTVPKGQARLNASVALVGMVNLSLISPSGKFAEFNFAQGASNYGNAQVADPQPGRWTALISTTGSGPPVPAKFAARTATWQPFGSLSASSLTLAPGASGAVTLTASTPPQAGDQSGSILLRSSVAAPAFAAVTSIPVTLRALIPTPSPSTTVTGTLTGGNGRTPFMGQSAYYQVQIPAGVTALNASVSTGDPSNSLLAELVDPSGATASAAANGLQVTTPSGMNEFKPELGAQLHVLNPGAGLWTVVVNFYNTVSGTAVTQPFTITVNDTPVTATASGLPDSASTTLAAGKPVTALVTVHNDGATPEAYFIDGRLARQATLKLASQTTAIIALPNLAFQIPVFLVPSHTTAINPAVSSPAPVFFDFGWAFGGDPDLGSSTGKTATGSFTAPSVPVGDWSVTPSLRGPFGAKPPNTVPATVSMTATTAAFDPAVTAPTGDLWLGSTDITTGFTPYVVNPGQSVTIPVTITPAGKAGTVVSGTVYVADSSVITGPLGGTEGSDVAAFPYSYTIS